MMIFRVYFGLILHLAFKFIDHTLVEGTFLEERWLWGKSILLRFALVSGSSLKIL